MGKIIHPSSCTKTRLKKIYNVMSLIFKCTVRKKRISKNKYENILTMSKLFMINLGKYLKKLHLNIGNYFCLIC